MLSSKPTLPSWLSTSWERSEKAGLRQRQRPDDLTLEGYHLKERRQRNAELISLVTNIALPLFSQRFARTDSRLILSDKEGVIIGSWGQPRFKEKLTGIALSSGACWTETLKGTNAIGTALYEQKPISVVANQHYILQHRFVSCSACPVFDPHGELLAVLDITSEQQEHDLHTQLFVQTLVQQLEIELLHKLPQAERFVELKLGLSSDFGTKAVVATDTVGNIIGFNHAAQQTVNRDMTTLTLDDIQSFVQSDSTARSLKTHSLPSLPDKPKMQPLHYGEPLVEDCWQQACKVIDKQIPILLLGDTGVGKNEFVKQLHRHSLRSKHPLVSVNCGALPAELVESELFGYAPGAFTGASPKGHIGKVRQAHRGTLFLDEVGDLPLAAQSRLLHVLQEKQVTPVGSVESVAVDIQIIAATHVDLEKQVAEGQFRQDLYYRLHGLLLELPKLADRKDKSHIIHAIHQKYAAQKQDISDELLQHLQQYHWPGNLRELDSLLNVACALAHNSHELTLTHIPKATAQRLVQIPLPISSDSQAAELGLEQGLEQGLDHSLNTILLTTYHDNQGNISQTARQLNISRNTLYRKLKAMGIK